MITIAFAPWAVSELTSEIMCWRSPPPARTICLTFGHLAASERTAAYDSCDHELMPKPSSIPRVIGFVPQNGMFFWIPVAAMFCASVGQVTFAAATAVPATARLTAARRSPSGSFRRRPAATRVASGVPISSLLDPGTGGRRARRDAPRPGGRSSSSRPQRRRGVMAAGKDGDPVERWVGRRALTACRRRRGRGAAGGAASPVAATRRRRVPPPRGRGARARCAAPSRER